MGCSPPGSSVHGILLAKILRWVITPSSRGFSQFRDRTGVSYAPCITGRFFIHWATWEAPRCSSILSSPSLPLSRLPRCLGGKVPACLCRRWGLDLWVGKIPWRRAWQPISVFLTRESHRQRSLVGCSPWGHKESDMTEQVNNNSNHCLSLSTSNYTGLLSTTFVYCPFSSVSLASLICLWWPSLFLLSL